MWVLNLPLLLILLTLLFSGCTVKVPTIAHTHIGHATTAWRNTPEQKGLLVVAEEQAELALEHAQSAATKGGGIDQIRTEVAQAVAVTNPQKTSGGVVKVEPPFGVKQALVGAIDHITFAGNSEDATQNVVRFAAEFPANSTAILERCDLISLLGEDIAVAASLEEAEILARELAILARANLDGLDADENGVIGNKPEEYGLRQLRDQLETMLVREDPPYTTVTHWYLFNLVQLPSGEWKFKERPANAGGNASGY
ncbi:MAG: hypothetical protein H6965_17035 [Chromatiaceae bacterium]|nr:hypothetical protein [Chromatiaceae bacterium]